MIEDESSLLAPGYQWAHFDARLGNLPASTAVTAGGLSHPSPVSEHV